jgi:hypothetical protein
MTLLACTQMLKSNFSSETLKVESLWIVVALGLYSSWNCPLRGREGEETRRRKEEENFEICCENRLMLERILV